MAPRSTKGQRSFSVKEHHKGKSQDQKFDCFPLSIPEEIVVLKKVTAKTNTKIISYIPRIIF